MERNDFFFFFLVGIQIFTYKIHTWNDPGFWWFRYYFGLLFATELSVLLLLFSAFTILFNLVIVWFIFLLQVLSVAVYNHYKRICHASLQNGLVFF